MSVDPHRALAWYRVQLHCMGHLLGNTDHSLYRVCAGNREADEAFPD